MINFRIAVIWILSNLNHAISSFFHKFIYSSSNYSRIFVTFIQLIIYIYNIYEFILLSIFLDIPIFLNIPKMLKCGKKVRSRSVYFHAQFQVPLNDIVSFPIVSAWNYDRGLEKRLINELEDSRDSMKLHERCSRGGEGAASFSATCRLDHKLTITIKQ